MWRICAMNRCSRCTTRSRTSLKVRADCGTLAGFWAAGWGLVVGVESGCAAGAVRSLPIGDAGEAASCADRNAENKISIADTRPTILIETGLCGGLRQLKNDVQDCGRVRRLTILQRGFEPDLLRRAHRRVVQTVSQATDDPQNLDPAARTEHNLQQHFALNPFRASFISVNGIGLGKNLSRNYSRRGR